MMCVETRLYFAMTEKNLAEKIFPYIPYQTMTWTDAELTKVLLDLTGLSQKTQRLKGKKMSNTSQQVTQYVYVVISLDFNKFNQRWRYESTEPIFRLYDQMLGTPNLYSYSHLFFQESYFYLSCYHEPPDSLKATQIKMQEIFGSQKSECSRNLTPHGKDNLVGVKD